MAEQQERAESKPTPRVLLMEFDVDNGVLQQDEGVWESLVEQFGGAEKVPSNLTILVEVGEAKGGPKAVVEAKAKTRGRFRAIARDSYDQGHEAIPPDQQKFETRPLT